MAYVNPSLGNYATPKSPGVDPGLAAITSILPLLGTLLPGKAGAIAGAFAGFPGQMLANQQAWEQAGVDQQNKQAVIGMYEGLPAPYIPRPNYPSVTPSYLRQAVGQVNAERNASRRTADSMLAAQGGTAQAAPYVAKAVDEYRANAMVNAQDTLGSILEKAHNAKIANDLSIAGMEMQRGQFNAQGPWQKASALASALMGYPWEVASNLGFLQATQDAAASYRDWETQRRAQADAKHAANQANALGWAGLGVGAVTDLTSAGLLYGGLKAGKKPGGGMGAGNMGDAFVNLV